MKKDLGRLWWLTAEQNNGTELFSYLEAFHNQCRYNTEPFDEGKRDI